MNKPISVEEADRLITTALYSPVSEACDLSEATNRVLVEDITADRDFPPFHRVAMDGIAIRYDDFHNGCRTFTIQGVQPAGNPPQILEEGYTCVEVMTGAVLPIGADTVIRYEDLNHADDQFDIVVEDIRPKQNVHHQGTDQKIGDILIPSGKYISPADVGILATVGKHQVQVHSLPKIAIISTGDELVDVSETPLPHQIRKSNVHVLSSFLLQLGMTADSFHLNDELHSIRNQLPGLIADYDVLLLSGAVSKGKFDHLPDVLLENGIRPEFHGVQQRPGKPFWFGRNDHTTVFAFPGNPVSTTLCAVRYFIPWFKQSMGIPSQPVQIELGSDVYFKPALTYFVPIELRMEHHKLIGIPHPGHGSGDLANLTRADGFMELPAGEEHHHAGNLYPFHGWRR